MIYETRQKLEAPAIHFGLGRYLLRVNIAYGNVELFNDNATPSGYEIDLQTNVPYVMVNQNKFVLSPDSVGEFNITLVIYKKLKGKFDNRVSNTITLIVT